METAGNILSTREQNKLARFYPWEFDKIPDRIRSTLLFGTPESYNIDTQVELEDLIQLKGQSVCQVHKSGTEFEKVTVLSSSFVQGRAKKLKAQANYTERRQAGQLRAGALGIVGSNLDGCNTSEQKKTRATLYKSQNMIQKIRLDGEPIVDQTICSCGKPLGKVVEIQHNVNYGSSSINGVQTCGSVWGCPVCRSRIISRRSEELKKIYDRWTYQGGKLYMITLTVPHSKSDNLAELYGSNLQNCGLSGALSKFRQSRHFSKEFKERAGYYGDMRGIEVTWGWANGFHPHIHMLVLVCNTIDLQEWKMRFHEVWSRSCLQSGLQEPSFERGVVISKCNTSDQAMYLAKWSAASELISQGMKIARAGNFSISELERCLWDESYRSTRQMSMTKAASILRAYYAAMKGQRMLQTGGIGPNHNWKKELLEIPDEKEETEIQDHTCYLKYRIYIKIKRAGKLPVLLEASETGGTRKARKTNIRNWLKSNGYDPGGIVNPYPANPPPLCLAYQTGFEEKFFQDHF